MAADKTAQLDFIVNAEGAEAGTNKVKKSLSSLGKSATTTGTEASKGLDKIGTASARTSRAIDSTVAKMQLQAASMGKTASQAALLELRQKGASAAQLSAAASALKVVDAYNAQQQALARTQAVATRLGNYVGTVAVAAFAGLGLSIRQALKDIDAFNDLKDATGASIENISALDRIARTTGSTFDQVSSILVKFNAALKEADTNKGIGATFKALNLDINELRRLDPAEALRRTSIALQGFADDGNKARAMQELFGKSIRDAGPLLKDLAEANGLVATTSTATASAVEQYNKNLFQLRANADDLTRSLTAGLVPVLNRLIVDIKDFPAKASLAGLAGDVIRFKKELDSLEARRGSPFNFAADLDAQIAAAKSRLDRAKAAFNLADVNRPPTAGAGRGFINPAAASTLPSLALPPEQPKGSTTDPLAEGKRYLENLERQIERARELSNYEQALTDIRKNRLGALTPALEKSILAAAKAVDVEKQQQAAIEGANNARMMAMRIQEQTDNNALASVQQQIEYNQSLREEIELIGLEGNARAAVEQARISSAIALKEEALLMAQNAGASVTQISALEREIALLKERAGLLGQRAQRSAVVEMQERFKDFTNGVNDDLKRAFMDAFQATSNPIKAFGDSLYSTISARVAVALAESFATSALQKLGLGLGEMSPAFVGPPSSAAGGGGFLSNIFGSFLGSILGPGRADGGPVSAGRLYPVNEKGPEQLRSAAGPFTMNLTTQED